MKCTFIGVGDAFDEHKTNTSVLVESGELAVLLDCGFTVPAALFRLTPIAADIDLIVISHFHGDHFFGIPYLLGRLTSAGRTEPLVFAGPEGVQEKVLSIIKLAYPSLMAKMNFALEFLELSGHWPVFFNRMELSSASVSHSGNAVATKLECDGLSLYYSGDGIPGDDASELARGCDLMIHESWGIEEGSASHFSARQCLQFATACECSRVALVHVYRKLRQNIENDFNAGRFAREGLEVLLPSEGDLIQVRKDDN